MLWGQDSERQTCCRQRDHELFVCCFTSDLLRAKGIVGTATGFAHVTTFASARPVGIEVQSKHHLQRGTLVGSFCLEVPLLCAVATLRQVLLCASQRKLIDKWTVLTF